MPRGPKGEKRPADVIGAAVKVMKIATGEIEEDKPENTGKNPAAVELGRKGGAVGGRRRMDSLSKQERVALAKKAAEARRNKRLIEQAAVEKSAVPKKKIKVSV